MHLLSPDGKVSKNMLFQVCDVTKALGSVSKMVARGNRVVFDSDDCGGSYIENKQDKSRLPLRDRGGVFVLDMWVKPAPRKQGFGRQESAQ